MDLKGKQIKNNTVQQSKLNITTDSIINKTDVTNDEYVNTRTLERINQINNNTLNKQMVANNATVGELATDTVVKEFPISPITVRVNNIIIPTGEGKDCYFTPDGETIRTGGQAQKGDLLIWNSSKYDLDDTDIIDFKYMVATDIVELNQGTVLELDEYYTNINVRYVGETGTTMVVIIDNTSFTVGNIGGQFVWDIGGVDEYTFTEVDESIIQNVNGEDYTIWFDGLGSLLFSISKGNLKTFIPFIMEIETTSENETFTIPHLSGHDYNYEVDWGDGSPTQSVNSYNDPNATHTYTSGSTYEIKISGICDTIYFGNAGDKDKVKHIKSLGDIEWSALNFYGCSNLETFTSGLFVNTTNTTAYDTMFYGCTSLTTFDGTGWDTSNVTTFYCLFYNCNNLVEAKGIENWDTSNVTNMWIMCFSCFNLEEFDMTNWDTSKVTNFRQSFNQCNSLRSIGDTPNLVTSECTLMDSMFSFCYVLENLNTSNWDLSNVTTMTQSFRSCRNLTTLDSSNWDMGSVQNLSVCFYDCTGLTYLDASTWNMGSATNLYASFYQCTSINNLDISNWNVQNVTTTWYMFYQCTSLTSVNITNWNTASLTDTRNMFTGCSNITTVGDLSGWNTSILNNCSSMFHSCTSLISVNMTNFITSGTTIMSSLFQHCSSLTTIGDTSTWNTSNLTSISAAFYNCWDLDGVDSSTWSMSNITNVQSLFGYCSSITNPAPEWWITDTQISTYSTCFTNNTLRPNYNSIPSSWGGGGA